MHITFQMENLKERGLLRELGIHGRVILKPSRFIWLRIGFKKLYTMHVGSRELSPGDACIRSMQVLEVRQVEL
jgi:hypothetical protein